MVLIHPLWWVGPTEGRSGPSGELPPRPGCQASTQSCPNNPTTSISRDTSTKPRQPPPGLCSLGAGLAGGGWGSDWGGVWTMGFRGCFFCLRYTATLTRIRCLRFTVSARDSPLASTCVCGVCVVGGSFQQPHRARVRLDQSVHAG